MEIAITMSFKYRINKEQSYSFNKLIKCQSDMIKENNFHFKINLQLHTYNFDFTKLKIIKVYKS